MNQSYLLSVLVEDRAPREPARDTGRRSGPGPPAGGSANEGDARDDHDARHSAQTRRATPAGPRPLADRSSALTCVVCRVGRRPPGAGTPALTGGVLITEPIEDSSAWLAARASAVSTGSPVLDRLLTGPGFLDAGAFRRSDSGPGDWSGSRPVGAPTAAFWLKTLSMTWPASSIWTLVARGRAPRRASSLPAAG
jgi:hypothetical protein